ncbi:MAG: hypothetical protein AB9835_14565 [Eubacteriales bacterium]
MIVLDGDTYNIGVKALKRKADVLDKYAERTEAGDLEREIIGVYFNYELSFVSTRDYAEYARLWDKLTEPVEFHEVTVPGENGDYTFIAYFSGISDEMLFKRASVNYWQNLTVNFTAKSPARS